MNNIVDFFLWLGDSSPRMIWAGVITLLACVGAAWLRDVLTKKKDIYNRKKREREWRNGKD